MTTFAVNHLNITRGRRTLCQDLNFKLNPGDFCAILGANGSGKSTLLQILCGQLSAASGEILLQERSLQSFTIRELAQTVGILFQDTAYTFAQSVYDYCAAARFPHQSLLNYRVTDHALIDSILVKMELSALSANNIQHLSGGEQRRAAIAALLIQTPQIYLLDEPTNHLDLPHQISVMQELQQLSRHHVVMASMHDINFAARFCNKVLLLFADGCSLFGDKDDLLTSANLSRLYQYPIDGLNLNDQTYWLPRQVSASSLTST